MEPGRLREKLEYKTFDQNRKEALKKEYEYFASIAPKSIFGNFSIVKVIGKIAEMPSGKRTAVIIGLIIFIPIWIMLLSMAIPILLILLFVSAVSKGRGSQEYRDYDYWNRIAVPTVKLIDDDLEMNFDFNPNDLVDTEMSYDDALVEGYMVVPVKKNSTTRMLSCCSYDWADPSNTDSFQFMGYKMYHEWEDSDGDHHEDVTFSGGIYKFHLSFSIKGTVNIMSTKTTKGLMGKEKERSAFKPIKDKKVNVIDTENHLFAESFDTVATFDDDAYRFLTPAMIESLLALRQDLFFCICIKGNVMTVTVDGGGYKDSTSLSISHSKPYYAPTDPALELDQKVDSISKSLLSVYELKDILDPGARM